MQLLDLEYQCRPINEDQVNELFGLMMINPEFSNEVKVKMSRRQLEFLEDFGSNIHKYDSDMLFWFFYHDFNGSHIAIFYSLT